MDKGTVGQLFRELTKVAILFDILGYFDQISQVKEQLFVTWDL